jgi:hypothetical protein
VAYVGLPAYVLELCAKCRTNLVLGRVLSRIDAPVVANGRCGEEHRSLLQ